MNTAKLCFIVKLALTSSCCNESYSTSFCTVYIGCSVKLSYYFVINFVCPSSDKFMYSPVSYLKTHDLSNRN